MDNYTQKGEHFLKPLFLFSLLRNMKQSSLFSNAFFLMLNTIVTSFLGFVFWYILAKLLIPAEVGIGSVLVAASGLIALLANFGLGVGVVRFIPEVRECAIQLVNSSFTLAGILAAIGSLIYLTGVGYWSPALGFITENFMYFVLFIFFTMGTSLSILTDQVFIAGRAARYVLLKNTLNSIIKILLVAFLSGFWGGFAIFASTGIGFLVGTILAWILFLPKVYFGFYFFPTINKDLICKIIPFSSANYIANLLFRFPQYIYPIMILNVLGAEENAFYAIAWMIFNVLAVIPNGMTQSLLAEGSHDPQSMRHNGRKTLIVTLLISLPAVFGIFLLGEWLLHFFGPAYAEHGQGVLSLLALAIIPQSVNMVFLALLRIEKRVSLIILQSAMLSVATLGLGYWLLGRMGLNGVGIAYAVAHFLVALLLIVPMWRTIIRVKD